MIGESQTTAFRSPGPAEQPACGSAITFTALGQPQPAGSKRAFRHKSTGRVLVVDANAKSKPWQAVVASAGSEAMNGSELLDGPLFVAMRFFQPHPKSHYRTGKHSTLLRDSAPMFPAGRPDVLKLARGVEDALSGVCWRDDAQIVIERLSKFYGEPARVEVSVLSLEPSS